MILITPTFPRTTHYANTSCIRIARSDWARRSSWPNPGSLTRLSFDAATGRRFIRRARPLLRPAACRLPPLFDRLLRRRHRQPVFRTQQSSWELPQPHRPEELSLGKAGLVAGALPVMLLSVRRWPTCRDVFSRRAHSNFQPDRRRRLLAAFSVPQLFPRQYRLDVRHPLPRLNFPGNRLARAESAPLSIHRPQRTFQQRRHLEQHELSNRHRARPRRRRPDPYPQHCRRILNQLHFRHQLRHYSSRPD